MVLSWYHKQTCHPMITTLILAASFSGHALLAKQDAESLQKELLLEIYPSIRAKDTAIKIHAKSDLPNGVLPMVMDAIKAIKHIDNSDDASKLIAQQHKQVELSPNKREKSIALQKLAWIQATTNLSQAMESFQLSLQNNSKNVASELGILTLYKIGRKLEQAVKINEQITHKGNLSVRQGHCKDAIFYYAHALSHDKTVKEFNRVGTVLNNIGVCAKKMGNYELARKAYSVAKIIYESQKDYIGAAVATGNVATIYERQNKKEEARYLFKLALKTLIKSKEQNEFYETVKLELEAKIHNKKIKPSKRKNPIPWDTIYY